MRSECHERHRHQEFLKFLRRLNAEFPGDVPLHLIMDNYGTHKHAKVKAWLKRHPRFVSHIPTSSSWMNLVERWFGHLDNKAIVQPHCAAISGFTWLAICSCVANQTPGLPFMYCTSFSSIAARDRCPIMCGCIVSR